MQVAQAADPLPDGAADLTGLYGTASAGERQLLLCTLDGLVISCQRYAITLEGTAPGVVRVSGEIRNGQLVASKSKSPAWDEKRADAQWLKPSCKKQLLCSNATIGRCWLTGIHRGIGLVSPQRRTA